MSVINIPQGYAVASIGSFVFTVSSVQDGLIIENLTGELATISKAFAAAPTSFTVQTLPFTCAAGDKIKIDKTTAGVTEIEGKVPMTVPTLPAGGVTGGVLTKNSDADFDASFIVPAVPEVTHPYDLILGFGDAPAANAEDFIIAVREFTVPTIGALGVAAAAATSDTLFTIAKNGVSIGTAQWLATTTVPSITIGSAVTFAAGDRIRLIAPNTPDATLANIRVAFLVDL